MGFIFLAIFAIAEIALAVLTCVKLREKAAWLKNRALVRAAETVLMLGIIIVPATHMKWRFIFALVVLIIRLLIAGISFLVNRRKAEGTRKKWRSVVSCILSVFIMLFALVPAFMFTNYNGLPTTGEYTVAETAAILVDSSRLDPFETDGSYREVPAHFYYPENASGEFPLIVFSHGAFGYYQSNSSTYAELASHGYIVAALDHPHHAFFTKDTDGKTVIVDNGFIYDAMHIGGGDSASAEEIYSVSKEWIELRIADESFVIDSIIEAKKSGGLSDSWHADDEAIVLSLGLQVGHFLVGQLVQAQLGGLVLQHGVLDHVLQDVDLDLVGIGFDVQAVLGVVAGRGLVFGHGEASDDGVTKEMVDNAKDGKLVLCPKANHMDFTDLSMLSPAISSMLSGQSGVDREEFMKNINSAVLNWFDHYLKNEGTLSIQEQY